MGRDIDRVEFNDDDFRAFQEKLHQQLEQLKHIIATPTFGDEPLKLGAELEMYLVDDIGDISLSNQLLLDELNDPQYQPELNQYNIELNLSAVAQKGKPFSKLRTEIVEKTGELEKIARRHKVNIVAVGILPTLRAEHLNADYMTDLPRYHCLAKHLYQQRGESFKININGQEPISVSVADICAEGANTSFQVHLMTQKDQFAKIFNAAQLTLPLVTAIGANSATFLGNRLWDETRIALFKQSIDIRLREKIPWQQPPRVNFGHGWLRNDAWELYAEAVALYTPIIPIIDDDHSNQALPALSELSTHMGSIWPWHRPVYSNHGNGHIRLEFRAIPAGPTSLDMVANAAFAIGLAAGLADDIDELISFIPFRFAEYNFYRAAQHGLDAKILWPLVNKHSPKEIEILQVIEKMIPIAKKGLLSLGVDHVEITKFISIIEQRLAQRITGAVWQKQTLKQLESTLDKRAACQKLVQIYTQNCLTCQPVAQWERIWT